jgi:predicted ATPase
MIKTLRLDRFKNFESAELALGNFTLLVGTNASGKSNLRDAFRFLHGISRGYTLAEIIGEKWIEGGSLQWKGIRGGTREVAYKGGVTFSLETTTSTGISTYPEVYKITVELADDGRPPRVVGESLRPPGDRTGDLYYDSNHGDDPPRQEGPQYIFVRLSNQHGKGKHGKRLRFASNQPVLSQIATDRDATLAVRLIAQGVIGVLASMRFFDLSPDAMRIPSLPGQDVLGDRGENLSSVLQSICDSPSSKAAVLEWIRELTPSDVADLEFVPDQTGRVLVTLVESGGQRTSAYSASDGTLRFLAMIAAMLGPRSAGFYFIEELENGIHPTRLHLLLQLIEQTVAAGKIQVVATTHSPQLLGLLSQKARAHAALIYRLENQPDARIRRIGDIPEAARVLEEQDLARLHSSGWLEDVVAFSEGGQS